MMKNNTLFSGSLILQKKQKLNLQDQLKNKQVKLLSLFQQLQVLSVNRSLLENEIEKAQKVALQPNINSGCNLKEKHNYQRGLIKKLGKVSFQSYLLETKKNELEKNLASLKNKLALCEAKIENFNKQTELLKRKAICKKNNKLDDEINDIYSRLLNKK
jgi:chromosome segregation ATPase